MNISHLAWLLGLTSFAQAFPAELWNTLNADPQLKARAAEILEERQLLSGADAAAKIFEPIPIWDKSQYIDTSPGSGHEWVAPGPADLRGPCPGLNAFANHNFLPHNGYATIAQFLDATMNVVGMGPGLAGFLAVYGAVIDGDGGSWSIGGTPPDEYLPSPPINGQKGNGISGSHNKYEGDASPTRPDLYQFGNDYKLRVQQYQQLMDFDPAPSNFDIATLTRFRSKRFDDQVANNKFFFNGPFSGVLVQPAAYTFMVSRKRGNVLTAMEAADILQYRFMANHTPEHTEGILSRRVLSSWFSIRGKNKHYKWIPGYEKIPDNWYRRPARYPYDQAYFLSDVANAAKIYPKFLNIGGNTGTKNSFTGVDVTNLTGGLIQGSDLLTGNKFACLAYQFAANAKPDVATNDISELEHAISGLAGKLTCPPLSKIDSTQLQMFPGYTKNPAYS